ncbi:hypothetical protein BTBSAS_80125 [Brochothrix thermosphacta]|uniref:Uncharacterized protein n=1 Tax=Brochothrix thermosphacta TaxID=2756 RepID=A0A2X0QQ16_BROTH|nr:hypothetical protein BTBSAS_80125 [Brochothrix thermosphacta]
MAGLDGLKKSLNSSHRLYNGSTLRGMLTACLSLFVLYENYNSNSSNNNLYLPFHFVSPVNN